MCSWTYMHANITKELFSRRVPYHNYASEIQAMAAISSRELPQFGDLVGHHAELLQGICRQCWNFNPEQRITISEILDTLPGAAD